MERLVFATQKLDPGDPVLAATVPMVRAVAERVDALDVLCDSAVAGAVPANVRVHEFGAPTQLQRGARFARALAQALRGRPLGVVAHMVPLYAVLAAPLVRLRGVPLVLWYTHWKGHVVVRVAERLCTSVVSVDERSSPLRSPKVRGIGHGIDLGEFSCSEAPIGEQLRVLVLGRYSPAKGLETVLRAASLAGARVEGHGSDATFESYKRELALASPARRRTCCRCCRGCASAGGTCACSCCTSTSPAPGTSRGRCEREAFRSTQFRCGRTSTPSPSYAWARISCARVRSSCTRTSCTPTRTACSPERWHGCRCASRRSTASTSSARRRTSASPT